MKALVLSGGAGTRLRPLTHTSAKQLVPVANKPVLFYGLEAIADAGITEVGIVVGDTADEIMQAVGDGSKFGLTVTYIPQDAPLGLAHAVIIARDFLADDDFVMYLATTSSWAASPPSSTPSAHSGPPPRSCSPRSPTCAKAGSPIGATDGQGLQEKPEAPKSDLALVGVYLFTPAVHEAVRAITPSWRGELEITHALQWLIDQQRDVRSTTISGYWKDTASATCWRSTAPSWSTLSRTSRATSTTPVRSSGGCRSTRAPG